MVEPTPEADQALPEAPSSPQPSLKVALSFPVPSIEADQALSGAPSRTSCPRPSSEAALSYSSLARKLVLLASRRAYYVVPLVAPSTTPECSSRPMPPCASSSDHAKLAARLELSKLTVLASPALTFPNSPSVYIPEWSAARQYIDR